MASQNLIGSAVGNTVVALFLNVRFIVEVILSFIGYNAFFINVDFLFCR